MVMHLYLQPVKFTLAKYDPESLNYPMVEAFFHMHSTPDKDYESYTASLQELWDNAYKARVQRENRDCSY